MKNRLSATQAREIAASAPVRRSSSRSPIWEKHKWKVLNAALEGQTEYLFKESDERLIEKLEKLGMSTAEVFRNKKIEQSRAEFQFEYQQMEEKRDGWYDTLKQHILQEKKITNRWLELRFFLDSETPVLDKLIEDLDAEDDDKLDDFNLHALELEMEDESLSYDYDLAFEKFVKNVHSYPSNISKLIQKIISDEDDYSSAKYKRDRLEDPDDWDNDEEEEESEEDKLFYSYKCPLPHGIDYGVIAKWNGTSSDLDFSKCTGQINNEMLSWISSKAGQYAIREVEREIENASLQKKNSCAIVLKIGKDDLDQSFEFEFPSFEIFKTVFEFLQYAVNLKGNLNHELGQSKTLKVSISWAV